MLEAFFLNLTAWQASVSVHNPNIVCIMESWLDSGTAPDKIMLSNFVPVRLDRDRHSEGEFLWINTKYSIYNYSDCGKAFWKSVGALKHKPSSISAFTVNGIQITSSRGK